MVSDLGVGVRDSPKGVFWQHTCSTRAVYPPHPVQLLHGTPFGYVFPYGGIDQVGLALDDGSGLLARQLNLADEPDPDSPLDPDQVEVSFEGLGPTALHLEHNPDTPYQSLPFSAGGPATKIHAKPVSSQIIGTTYDDRR